MAGRCTQAAYSRDLEGLARWLGGKPELDKITPDTLARDQVDPPVVLRLLRGIGVDKGESGSIGPLSAYNPKGTNNSD